MKTRQKGPVARVAEIGLVSVLVLSVLAQFVPVARGNPPVESEIEVPAVVSPVLRRACYDCHSNETVWPWYSRIAPASWLVAKDVQAGREALNYSTWDRVPLDMRVETRAEIWEEIEERQMPPPSYLVMHPEARLSDADRELLRTWALGLYHVREMGWER